jgi:hypothetical protein
MLTEKQAPYTGPYASTATKFDSEGPTVIALKRAISRLGYLTWKGDEFTDQWPAGQSFDKAYRRWQLDEDMPADGVYGRQSWKMLRYAKVPPGKPHAGEYALDKYSQDLLRKEWDAEHTPDEDDIRTEIAHFCRLAEGNEDDWHYRQARPVDITVNPLASYVWSDCSGYVIQAYRWARDKTGLLIPDPAIQKWTGYGNTDWYEDDHPRVGEPYRTGDLAHYRGHVTLCRRGGTSTASIWSSHGQEAGPMPLSLHYRSDLRFVCRPPLKEGA